MRVFWLASLVLLVCAFGCGGGGGGGGSNPPPMTVTVSPNAISLTTGQVQAFNASVTGSGSSAVTWQVLEGAAGGSITSGGVYTASSTPGTYHIVAISQANTSASGAATVTVVATSQSGTIQGTIQ